MVTQLESTLYNPTIESSPLTRKYSKSALQTGNTPVAPERFIKGERNKYPLEELLDKSMEELGSLGISEEEVISLLVTNTPLNTRIRAQEKEDASLDEVLTWATSYWNEINTRLTRRMDRYSVGQNKEGAVLADARIRALGVVTFISSLENYTSRESLEDTARILSMASDLFIMSEFSEFSSKVDTNLFSHSLNSLVNTGLARPDLFDKAVELASSNIPENITIKHDLESRILGIKTELLVAKIISEFEVSDENVELVISKPYAIRDVQEAADFVITSETQPNGGEREMCIVEVRKSGASEPVGACRACVSNGELTYYQGDNKLGHLKELYDIEPNFIRNLIDNKIDGLVVRLSGKLPASYTAQQIAEIDKSADHDYNDAKAQIHSELRQILERSK
jgi:hypothetical protein